MDEVSSIRNNKGKIELIDPLRWNYITMIPALFTGKLGK